MKKIYNVFALLLTAFGLYSCSNDIEKIEEVKGYLQLEMTTVVSTNTRAKDVPDDYDSKTLEVRILDAQGKEVKKSIYKDGKFENNEFASPIKIAPGDYTVEAHSANWDGSNSGWDAAFYAGSTDVKVIAGHLAKAKVILTQDNVKVEVFWDNSFRNNFKSATSKIEMSEMEGISSRTFKMDDVQRAAYFPVGDLYWTLKATNNKDAVHFTDGTINNLQPRDYVRITYSVKEAGTMDDINIYLDESTRTYTITIKVPRETTISLVANKVTETEANSESGWAQLSGVAVGKDLNPTNVIMKYKKVSDSEWTDILNNKLTFSEPNNDGEIKYSYKLNLESSPFDYEYRLVYIDNGEESATSDSQKFRVNGGDALYNGDFELWHDEGSIGYPTESESVKYWSSSNPASGSVLGSLGHLTDKTSEKKHHGSYAAMLSAKSTMGFLAAASLYTGSYVDGSINVSNQTVRIKWGVPFSGRPKSLHGYMIYEPGNVNNSKGAADNTPLPSDAPAEGTPDHCQIYCALMNIDAPLEVYNGDLSTFPNWNTDQRVIAFGALTQKSKQNDWTEFDINLDYRDTTTKPKYLIIVASSCKYGDYFHGSSKSVLYLDEFELRY